MGEIMIKPTSEQLLAYTCEWLSRHIGCPNEANFLMCQRECLGSGRDTEAECWRKFLVAQWRADTKANGWVPTGPKSAIKEGRG